MVNRCTGCPAIKNGGCRDWQKCLWYTPENLKAELLRRANDNKRTEKNQ